MSDEPNQSKSTAKSKAIHKARLRHDRPNLIDDLIEEGREQGAFDNLPGKGKPLNLKRNLFAPELELAHGLLQQNDMKPAWITARRDLLAQIEALRAAIQRQWQRHESAYRQAQSDSQRGPLIISWDDACLRWEKQITALNKEIDVFNFKRPSDNLEIFKLSLTQELERAGARRWLRA